MAVILVKLVFGNFVYVLFTHVYVEWPLSLISNDVRPLYCNCQSVSSTTLVVLSGSLDIATGRGLLSSSPRFLPLVDDWASWLELFDACFSSSRAASNASVYDTTGFHLVSPTVTVPR